MSDEIQDPLGTLRRMWIALGMVAPGGTAPREALDALADACMNGTDPRPAISALEEMLEPNWGDHGVVSEPKAMPRPASFPGGNSVEGQLAEYFHTVDKPFGSWWVMVCDYTTRECEYWTDPDHVFPDEGPAIAFANELAARPNGAQCNIFVIRPEGSRLLVWDGRKFWI